MKVQIHPDTPEDAVAPYLSKGVTYEAIKETSDLPIAFIDSQGVGAFILLEKPCAHLGVLVRG